MFCLFCQIVHTVEAMIDISIISLPDMMDVISISLKRILKTLLEINDEFCFMTGVPYELFI